MSDTRDPPDRDGALAERLATFDRVVEVGIGRRHGVAARLADRGVTVTATDVSPRSVPAGVEFVVDDVTDPDPAVYAGADAVYALHCPPELHRPALSVARGTGAALAFTTLGGDPPAVEADPETVATTTLWWARPPGRR